MGDGDADGGVAVEAAQVGQVVELLVNTRDQAQRNADPFLFVGKGSEYFASAEGLRRGFGDGLGFPTYGERSGGRCDRMARASMFGAPKISSGRALHIEAAENGRALET